MQLKDYEGWSWTISCWKQYDYISRASKCLHQSCLLLIVLKIVCRRELQNLSLHFLLILARSLFSRCLPISHPWKVAPCVDCFASSAFVCFDCLVAVIIPDPSVYSIRNQFGIRTIPWSNISLKNSGIFMAVTASKLRNCEKGSIRGMIIINYQRLIRIFWNLSLMKFYGLRLR